MTTPKNSIQDSPIHKVRGADLIRNVQRYLPLAKGHGYLLGLSNPANGLLSIPFENRELVQPAVWRKQAATYVLFGKDVVPEFEYLLVPLLRELKTGSIVDIGANIGIYSLLIRNETALPVIAFEPQPFLFDILKVNVSHNNLAEVDCRNVACGDCEGELLFYLGINGSVVPEDKRDQFDEEQKAAGDKLANEYRRHPGVATVPVSTLDAQLSDTKGVSLLKLDVEGFEWRVLTGAKQVLKENKPILFIELHPTEIPKHGGSVSEIFKMLSSDYEFEVWHFSHSHLQPGYGNADINRNRVRFFQYENIEEYINKEGLMSSEGQDYLVARPR